MRDLKIIHWDDPVLRQKAAHIRQIEPRHRALADQMAALMYEASGIGLAANQVGLLERIIIVDVEYARAPESAKPTMKPVAMINPEVIEESVEDDSYNEGCLSLPGIEGEVWRPVKIKYRYQDLAGAAHEREAEGLLARCIQHEIDHLNGVLFVDRLSTIKRKLLAPALRRLAKQRAERLHGAAQEGARA